MKRDAAVEAVFQPVCPPTTFEEGISEERALDLVLEWLSPTRLMELCREATELYMWDRYGSDN